MISLDRQVKAHNKHVRLNVRNHRGKREDTLGKGGGGGA